MQFKGTDYATLPGLVETAFGGGHGARAAAKQMVLVVTDGKMGDMNDVYAANNCPVKKKRPIREIPSSNYSCNTASADYDLPQCAACMRGVVAAGFSGNFGFRGEIYSVAVGADVDTDVDIETLEIIAGKKERVIRE